MFRQSGLIFLSLVQRIHPAVRLSRAAREPIRADAWEGVPDVRALRGGERASRLELPAMAR